MKTTVSFASLYAMAKGGTQIPGIDWAYLSRTPLGFQKIDFSANNQIYRIEYTRSGPKMYRRIKKMMTAWEEVR